MATFTAIMAAITTVIGVIKDVSKAAWPIIKVILIVLLSLFGVALIFTIPAFITVGTIGFGDIKIA